MRRVLRAHLSDHAHRPLPKLLGLLADTSHNSDPPKIGSLRKRRDGSEPRNPQFKSPPLPHTPNREPSQVRAIGAGYRTAAVVARDTAATGGAATARGIPTDLLVQLKPYDPESQVMVERANR